MPVQVNDEPSELNVSEAIRRRRWRAHFIKRRRLFDDDWRRQDAYHDALLRWAEGGFKGPMPLEPKPPDFPPLPDDLHNLTCGAKTRAGTPCKRTDLYASGRCRFHGGLSTGPLTPEGKQRAALNGLRPKKKRTPCGPHGWAKVG